MALLGGLSKEYDQRAVELGLYTVDVIGDCYMCAANLIKPLPNHVSATVGFAQSILQVANATLTPLGTPLRIRIGSHSGPAMSGVIGVHHLKFTLVGDTVNVASRMESSALPNMIQTSKHAYKQLQREQLAMLSEAAGEQEWAAGGLFADQDMLGQASEDCGRALVRGNSTRPCSLNSLPQKRWEDSAEFGCFLGRNSGNRSSPELAAQAQQHPWQQWPGTAAQAAAPPVTSVPRHSSAEHHRQQEQGHSHHGNKQKEPQPQQQQQQQQCCHLQPRARRPHGRDQLQQPECLNLQSCSLSQGGAASCAAMSAEQSSCPCAEQSRHTCEPGGLEHVFARPSCQLQAWRPGEFLYSQKPDIRHPAQVVGHHSCGGGHRKTCHGSGNQGPGCSSSLDHGRASLSSLDQEELCPVGQGGGPVDHLKCSMKSKWLERELNIKGKGVMKVYTYTGQAQPGP